ncbi:MAG: NADH-quinone oxidoreductase subunit C [Thermoplasmata archaeon]|nr:NADH-quinone oxidoreductase subunit C [Thermoplasmata archaeon]
MEPNEVEARLRPVLGDRLLSVDPFVGTAGKVRFRPEGALDLFRAVRDQLGFLHLSMVAGVDWVDRREVVYVAWSDTVRQYLMLSADLPADAAHIESAVPVWPAANWHEREAFELLAIQFDHHPDLRHLLTPEGYEFHPLLRSFKLHEPEELEVKTRNV